MFALWNHLLGTISKEEMTVYESEFGGSFKQLGQIPFLQHIDCLVLLNDEPAQCKFRVEQLRKNSSEQGIPLSYYEGIDDMHFNIFMKLLTEKLRPVLILNWGQYHDPKQTLEIIRAVSSGTSKSPSVKYIPFEDLPACKKQHKYFIYPDEKRIHESYDEWKEFEELHDLRHFKTIYFPKDVMKIDLKEKNVVDNDYNLSFYQNEYKRVVLYHLSQSQQVIFYSSS